MSRCHSSGDVHARAPYASWWVQRGGAPPPPHVPCPPSIKFSRQNFLSSRQKTLPRKTRRRNARRRRTERPRRGRRDRHSATTWWVRRPLGPAATVSGRATRHTASCRCADAAGLPPAPQAHRREQPPRQAPWRRRQVASGCSSRHTGSPLWRRTCTAARTQSSGTCPSSRRTARRPNGRASVSTSAPHKLPLLRWVLGWRQTTTADGRGGGAHRTDGAVGGMVRRQWRPPYPHSLRDLQGEEPRQQHHRLARFGGRGRGLASTAFRGRRVTLSGWLGPCRERLAAQLLIDPEAHPIFLHCMNGAEVTGLLVMCLRKLQMWSQTFALIEFSRSAEHPPRCGRGPRRARQLTRDEASLGGGRAAGAGRCARASLRRTRPTLWTSSAARSRCPRGCRGGCGRASRWPDGTPRLSWWYAAAGRARHAAWQGGRLTAAPECIEGIAAHAAVCGVGRRGHAGQPAEAAGAREPQAQSER